jgi:hypothetical protein
MGELGALYFAAPNLSLGATATGQLVYQRISARGPSGPSTARVTSWELAATGPNLSLAVTLFF